MLHSLLHVPFAHRCAHTHVRTHTHTQSLAVSLSLSLPMILVKTYLMVCLPADGQDCLMKQGLTSQVAERKLAAAAKATSDISYDIALAMQFIKDQVSSTFSSLLCCFLYSALMLHFCLVLCSVFFVPARFLVLCCSFPAVFLVLCCLFPALLLDLCCLFPALLLVLWSVFSIPTLLLVLSSAPCSLFCIPVLPLVLSRNFMFAGDCLHPRTGIHWHLSELWLAGTHWWMCELWLMGTHWWMCELWLTGSPWWMYG